MSKLFNENIGSASNSTQLAELKKKFNHYDPIYVASAAISSRTKFREWLETLWEKYEPYADKNFIDEFKKQFTQRAWELHLGSTLLNRGYILESKTPSGPDFKISHKDINIWIEAIAVKKGYGKDKVPDLEAEGEIVVIDVPEKEMMMRLTSALKEKYRKYLQYLENGQIKETDPFVIAIDRSDLKHLDAQIPLILKCLFAIGYQVLFIKNGKPKPKIEGSTWSSRDKINKANGSEIPLLFFRDATYKGISAVIYCVYDILNSPKDPSHMGNNFVLVYNPFAKNPLPDNFFEFGETWIKKGNHLKKFER